MWSILDIPRGYAAPLDRRVFAGCVTVNSCANLSRQVAKRSDASMGAKVVHTPTEAVRFVNANLVKTGWTWHGGIYVGRSRLSEEEMEETFRCIVGANLVPEVPVNSAPPRYRRMTSRSSSTASPRLLARRGSYHCPRPVRGVLGSLPRGRPLKES